MKPFPYTTFEFLTWRHITTVDELVITINILRTLNVFVLRDFYQNLYGVRAYRLSVFLYKDLGHGSYHEAFVPG